MSAEATVVESRGSGTGAVVDFAALRAAEAVQEPFPYLIVPRFVRGNAQSGIEEDFPQILHRGSFPLASLRYGSRFAALIEALTGAEMTQIVEQKFAIDLAARPTTATVRGMSDLADGHIHIDSKSKLITLLLYTNREWECCEGRLRLLRKPDDLQDYVAEIPPEPGTLVIFRNTPNAWHGFEPFVGQRRVIQVNWVTDDAVARRETARHRLSAVVKRLLGR
jgi:SM-20-related protein